MAVPMDVVFSFDTSGSMSKALDEVKARVNDIVQKLHSDIPYLRIGIIAHGDYCDAEHFYVIRTLDLCDSVADVVTFINDTDGTGGGDIPECYELALQRAKEMSWQEHSRRILVMIGDAYPHEADYELNVQNIDWRDQLKQLAQMNVRIYGVQIENDELSTQFFQQMKTQTEGQHLQLSNMGRICEVIVGICYREQGPVMFQNYEAEVREKEVEKFGPDLECMFGTLRHEVSRTSDLTTILDRDDDEVDEDVEMRDNDVSKDTASSSNIKLKRVRFNSDILNASFIPAVPVRSRMKRLHFESDSDSGNDNDGDNQCVPTKRRKISKEEQTKPQLQLQLPNLHQNVLKVQPPVARVPTKNHLSRFSKNYKRYRERVSNPCFKYKALPWSPWKLAACPKDSMKRVKDGDWQSVFQGSANEALRRRDLFKGIPKSLKSYRMFFELAIVPKEIKRRKVVSFHTTRPSDGGKGVFSLPWYRGMFRSVRHSLNKAMLNKCKVYIRWTHVTSRFQWVSPSKVYDYAWSKNGQKRVNLSDYLSFVD